MKKVLLGSTALVAAGLIAAPSAMAAEKLQVSVGGYMEQWFGYTSVDEDASTRDVDGFDVKSDSEIHFKGSTTLDNGIEFGINVQLEANTSGDQIDESYLIMKGSFGEINLGSENSALYKMHYAPSDFGIGINSGDQGDWAALTGSSVSGSGYFRGTLGSTYVEPGRNNDAEKLTYYTPRFAGFQLGASYSPDDSQDDNSPVDRNVGFSDMVAFGANYSGDFSGVSLGVSGGYGTYLESASGVDEPEVWSAGVTLGIGGFGIGASYANEDGFTEGESYNLGVSYETGPFGVSFTYFHGQVENSAEQDTFHLSGKYALGPGVTANATLGYAEFQDEGSAGTDELEATYVVTGIRLSF